MKILKIALAVIVFLVLAGTGLYAYYGGFTKVNVRLASQGGETVVYNEIIGDYSQSGLVMDTIYKYLKEKEQIVTTKGFGIYFDNPRKVKKSKLRSEAGCIIEAGDVAKVSTLTGDFKIKVLPKKQYIVAEFPYEGKLSIMVSIMKVYPSLKKYAEKNGFETNGAVMEIYDIPNGQILYREELNKK